MAENTNLGFNKKRRPKNDYTKLPDPTAAFEASNTDLLANIEKEEDILKTNSKSLGIPAETWCNFMALLEVTDNDYTYELLEELIEERKHRLDYSDNQVFQRSLERKKDQERLRIQKKMNKKK